MWLFRARQQHLPPRTLAPWRQSAGHGQWLCRVALHFPRLLKISNPVAKLSSSKNTDVAAGIIAASTSWMHLRPGAYPSRHRHAACPSTWCSRRRRCMEEIAVIGAWRQHCRRSLLSSAQHMGGILSSVLAQASWCAHGRSSIPVQVSSYLTVHFIVHFPVFCCLNQIHSCY
jgi:hypothetical protein